MKVLVYPDAGDGITNISTWPEPIELAEVGKHLEQWLQPHIKQGYYFNANMQRVPLDVVTFRIEFADDEPDGIEIPPRQRTEAEEHARLFDGTDLSMEGALPA